MSSRFQINSFVPRSAEYSAGTTSIKLALERLGHHKAYQMSTFIDHTEDYMYWRYAIKARISGLDTPRSVCDDLFGNYQVVDDAPGCYFVSELAAAYPNAKVIILSRDSEKWHGSFTETVQKMIKHRESLEILEWILRPCMPTHVSAIIRIGNLLSKSELGLGSYDEGECLRFFYRYYADCRARIAPEHCIDFKVQDGWFPSRPPFPRANNTQAFYLWATRVQYSMLRQVWKNVLLYGLLLLGPVVLFVQMKQFTRPHYYTRDT
ncbi:hypothetical protein GGR58DRAFT_521046 [Xylaria digitata]|nr:hypothetical protein GGR58DRAFT_521046 [Xylaria digitata]